MQSHGIDGNYCNRFMNNDSLPMSDAYCKKFTDAFGLPGDYFDVVHMKNDNKNLLANSSCHVPLLSCQRQYDAYISGELAETEVMAIDDDLYTSTTFAIEHEGDAMAGGERPIHNKDRIIFDPELEPEYGDVVYARIKSTGANVVRAWVTESSQIILNPFNRAYPTIHLCAEDKVLAVAKSIQTRLRPNNS